MKLTSQSHLVISSDSKVLKKIADDTTKQFAIADVFWLRAKEDAKSITVEQVQDFVDKSHLSAVSGKKLLIIEDVSIMTIAAQNKMLKTLEDTNESTFFLLLATDEWRVLPTIKSRCVISHQNDHSKSSIKIPDKIHNAAKMLFEASTLDNALPHIAILTAKDSVPLSLIALSQNLNPKWTYDKRYAILKTLAQINRNIGANCNATNAFDLLILELFR